jgi:hypothetical protein
VPNDLHHGLLSADGFDDGVGTKPVREFFDFGSALIASILDDVGRSELAGKMLAGLVPAHGDDPFRAKVLGCKHAE